MFIYHYARHRVAYEESFESIEQIILRAAADIDDNNAMPIQIGDESGAVVMERKDLNGKAWEYINTHNI